MIDGFRASNPMIVGPLLACGDAGVRRARQGWLTSEKASSKIDGMTEMSDLAVAASGSDVRTGLRATVALRRLAERLEILQVANARRQGWSWQEIAEVLEVSKQAVHQKHAAHAPEPETRRRKHA